MNIKWAVLILGVMIALVIVLSVMPKHYDETTGKISTFPPKSPRKKDAETPSLTPVQSAEEISEME